MKDFVTLATVCLVLAAFPCAKVLGAEYQPQPATTEVVSTGIGVDADKALKNALMNAVQQVVGLIVDAETLVKNDSVVRDQILTYSDGFVETFRKLQEKKRDDGLFEVTLSAVVKRRQLMEKLRESNVSAVKLDGKSLFGELVTQNDAAKDGAALLNGILSGAPVNLLSASVVDAKPRILDRTDSAVRAAWNIVVTFDWEGYSKKVLPKLQEALASAAVRKASSEMIETAETTASEIGGPALRTPSGKYPFWHHLMRTTGDGLGNRFLDSVSAIRFNREQEILVFLNVGRSEDRRTRRWLWYVLDRRTAVPVLAAVQSQKLAFRFSVLDSDQNVLRQSDIPLNRPQAIYMRPYDSSVFPVETKGEWLITNPWWQPSVQSTFRIAPFVELDDVYGEALEFRYSSELTLDEVKRIAEIRCSVVSSVTPHR